jgi:ABC-2 type transport system permease protein
MNLRTFGALLRRDMHVARRNFAPVLIQNLLQPMLLVFVFGRLLTGSGLMPVAYKSMLLPGVIALSMLFAGVQSVAMTLISEFQFTREIEDRLLAPIGIGWVAAEKIAAGMLQALVAGLVVIPAAWLLMGRGVELSFRSPWAFALVAILVALLSSALGLVLGCSISGQHIGLMFSLILAPMLFFGCTYYPWSALNAFPVLQKLVLVNPIVYASEGFRATLAPHLPHMARVPVFAALVLFDAALVAAGLDRFRKKALS